MAKGRKVTVNATMDRKLRLMGFTWGERVSALKHATVTQRKSTAALAAIATTIRINRGMKT